jgi:hypothetical protein
MTAGALKLIGHGGDPSRLVPPPGACASKRWRFRRDMVIFVAYVQGFSQRDLADVFDLPQSRISAIVRDTYQKLNPDADPVRRTAPSRPGRAVGGDLGG